MKADHTIIRRLLALALAVSLMYPVTGCTKPESEDPGTGGSETPGPEDPVEEDKTYVPTAEDLAVDQTLFNLMDLSVPGLEDVRRLHEEKRFCEAADAVVAYFKTRTAVRNPLVTIPVVQLSAANKANADAALPEGGYRFVVHSGMFQENLPDGQNAYPSFSDGHGGVDWEYMFPNAGAEFYQKHWHNWFAILGMAYSNTGDEKYFEAWKAQYSDWLEKYPCPSTGRTYTDQSPSDYGYKSWHALSMATRITSQVNIFDYFISSEGFDFEWLTTFLKAFDEAVQYSQFHLYYEPTSNIRFAQYKAHALAGMHFPELRNAATWFNVASRYISNDFNVSFNEDGVQNELDMGYHVTVVNNYREVHLVAEANGRLSKFPADYLERIHKSCRFVMDYMYPNYLWECFNETRQTSASVTRRYASEYSQMFPEDQVFRYFASSRAEGTSPDQSLVCYPVSGYYMFRSGWEQNSLMLIYKNNYNPQAKTHSHLDNGNVGLYANGRIFLPSSGSYTYGGGDMEQFRQDFKATANHNTVTRGLETIGDSFSKGRLLKSESSAALDMVVAQNQSYSDLTHRRTVWMVDRKFFVVADAAFGANSGSTVNLSWHLCRDEEKGVDVVAYDAVEGGFGAHTLFSDGNNMSFRTFAESACGSATGISEYSEVLGVKKDRKFYRVSSKKEAGKAVRFITVILPSGTASSETAVTAVYTDGGFKESGESLEVTVGGAKYVLSYTVTE